jgi:O-antigen/teichoic acid export membrane protein
MQSLLSWLKRPRIATAACIVVLMLLPFMLFLSVTLGGQTLIPADNLFQYQPFRAMAAQFGIGAPHNALLDDLILQNYQWKTHTLNALRSGELPLWNPYTFAGAPFIAAGQHSMLYPLSVLYLILPLPAAYGWFTVLQLGVADVFMFIFLRMFGLKRMSALFGGAAWQLSGFMLVSPVHPMIIAAASWLPLILAMCERVIQQSPALGGRPSSMPWVVIGAFAVAMMALAGHVEIMVYTALVVIVYCVWRISTVIGFRNLRVDGKYLVGRVGWLVIMGSAGLVLAAIQILPLLELVTRNFRGAGRSTFEQVLSYGFPERYVLMWLMPNIFGNPAHHTYFDLFTFSMQPVATQSGNTWWGIKDHVEGAVYIGLITLLFAGMAIANAVRGLFNKQPSQAHGRKTFPAWFFIALSVASLLFVFGTVFYAVLYYGLPGISQLHSPYRWKIPLTFCLTALAAYGFDGLLAEARAARSKLSGMRLPTAPVQFARATLIAPYAGMAIGALAIIAIAAARLMWPAVEPVFAGALNDPLVQRGFATPQAFFSYTAGNVLIFGATLIVSSAVWLLLIQRRRSQSEAPSALLRFAPVAAIALLVLDMNIGYVGFNPSVDPKLLDVTPDAIQFLQAQPGQWRYTAFEPAGSAAFKPMNMNMGWRYGIEDVRGYDSIIPRQYTDFMAAIEPQGDLLYNRIGPIKNPQSLDSPLLDLLGVKYVVAEAATPIDNPGYQKVFDDGNTLIYENTRALPRAYVMPLSSTVAPNLTASYPPGESPSESPNAWFAETIQSVDPRKHVLVASADFALASIAKSSATAFEPATITSYKNNEVWVDAEVDGPSWLILNDSMFPGWRAFVRPLGAPDSAEREAPITTVNGNFRGVQLEIGNWLLENQSTSDNQSTNNQQPTAVTVRFRYSPQSFQIGAFGSFIALAGLLFLGGIYLWRNWPRTEKKSATGVRLVARNSAILTGLNIVARLIDFAFALLMLRVLGPEGAGNYYFAVVIVGWFEIVMNFGLNTYLTREVSRDKANAAAYLAQTSRLRMLLALAALPVMLVLVALEASRGNTALAIVIALLVLSQFPSSLATGLSAVFFAHERAEVPAALTIVSALLKAAIGAALLLAGWGVIGLGVTSLVVNLITLVILFIAARRIYDLRLRIADSDQSAIRNPQSKILRESFPLMLNHLLATLFFKVDVPLLQAIKGPVAVGYYSAAYKFIDAFNIIPAFFTQSLFPAMSRMALQRDQTLARSYTLALKLLVMVSLPLAVTTTFLAEPMIGILGGREFLPEGAIALAIMCWSMPIGWINSVTNYALIAAGQQRALTRAFIIGLTFNIVANLALIPVFSFVAAAVVTIFSEIVEGTAFYVYVHRHIAPVNWVEALAKPFLAAGAMAAVTSIFAMNGLVLIGLLLGLALYGGVLGLTGALAPQEREILRPLIRRSA